MVKVLCPDGHIIGVFDSAADVPERLWNRTCSYNYPTKELEIIEVTDPKDKARLMPTLEEMRREYGR